MLCPSQGPRSKWHLVKAESGPEFISGTPVCSPFSALPSLKNHHSEPDQNFLVDTGSSPWPAPVPSPSLTQASVCLAALGGIP